MCTSPPGNMLLATSHVTILRLLGMMSSLWMAHCCQETFFTEEFRQDPSEVIASYSISRGDPNCRCCGLCHQHADCASFSANNNECELYRSVGSYATITEDKPWRYFIMPNRSEHHQFCREDSDCQAGGDICRASVCSQLDTITCKVIFETLGSQDRIATNTHHHRKLPGWLNGQPLALACLMRVGRGYTRLLLSKDKSPFTREEILSYDEDLAGNDKHSILRLAEDILQTSDAPNYRLLVTSVGGWPKKFEMELPHSEAVLATAPRPISGKVVLDECGMTGSVGLPWTPSDGPQLFTLADKSFTAVTGDIACSDGTIVLDKLKKKAAIFISE